MTQTLLASVGGNNNNYFCQCIKASTEILNDKSSSANNIIMD